MTSGRVLPKLSLPPLLHYSKLPLLPLLERNKALHTPLSSSSGGFQQLRWTSTSAGPGWRANFFLLNFVTSPKYRPLSTSLQLGTEKSQGAKAGEQRGCSSTVIELRARNLRTMNQSPQEHCRGTESSVLLSINFGCTRHTQCFRRFRTSTY